MTEAEFLAQYKTDKDALLAWGQYIKDTIDKELSRVIAPSRKITDFVKINFIPRLKEDESIIEKAFYREKKYRDPYLEITDKIGMRYVILLSDEIKIVETAIETNNSWRWEKARDYEEERKIKPLVFDYQSVHYIVWSTKVVIHNGLEIPINTPCEVQIRTLLQHAYSELTHETIYKKKLLADPDIYRNIARSMALVETTDLIFNEVKRKINQSDQTIMELYQHLKILHSVIVKAPIEERYNQFIFDAFREEAKEIQAATIDEFLAKNDFLRQTIINNSAFDLPYRQPVIFLIYYLVKIKKEIFLEKWPFPKNESDKFFVDLGIAPK